MDRDGVAFLDFLAIAWSEKLLLDSLAHLCCHCFENLPLTATIKVQLSQRKTKKQQKRSAGFQNTVTSIGCFRWEPVKTATTRTATLSGITTRTATLLWSKRPHCFGQNGHISWLATSRFGSQKCCGRFGCGLVGVWPFWPGSASASGTVQIY